MKYAAAFNFALVLIIFVERGSAEIIWDTFDSPEMSAVYESPAEDDDLVVATPYPGPAEYRTVRFRDLDQWDHRSDGTYIQIADGTLTAYATGAFFSMYSVAYGGTQPIGLGINHNLNLDLEPGMTWEVDYTLSLGEAVGSVPMSMVMTSSGEDFSFHPASLSVEAVIAEEPRTIFFPVSQFAQFEEFSLDDVDGVGISFLKSNAIGFPVRFQIHEVRLIPEPSMLWLFLLAIPFFLFFKRTRS